MKYSIQQTEEGKNDLDQQSFKNQFLGLEIPESENNGQNNNRIYYQKQINQEEGCQNQEIQGDEQCEKKKYLKQKRGKKNVVEWSSEEDQLLFQKFISEGSKWVQIAHVFPTKSDNDVKNRFYCCIRRVLKKINQFQLGKKIKPKKLISFDCLLTYLQISKFNQNQLDGRFSEIKKKMNQILQVRQLIFDMALKGDKDFDRIEVESLISKIIQLKYTLKFINIRRVKKSAEKGINPNKVNKVGENSLTHKGEGQENKMSGEQKIGKIEDNKQQNMDFFDIERLAKEILVKDMRQKKSLMQQCSHILCSELMEIEECDELCF